MVSRSIRLGVGHTFGANDQIFLFLFFCRTIALLFVLGHPLWREDGSVICSAICQWSESRKTHNHTLLSHPRLLGSLSVSFYDSQELRWKYSNPPLNGGKGIRIETNITFYMTGRAWKTTCRTILLLSNSWTHPRQQLFYCCVYSLPRERVDNRCLASTRNTHTDTQTTAIYEVCIWNRLSYHDKDWPLREDIQTRGHIHIYIGLILHKPTFIF
jgi:hypothetical protein